MCGPRRAGGSDARGERVQRRLYDVLRARKFQPHTFEGQRLIARELVHIHQQRTGRIAPSDDLWSDTWRR
jgi:hypothetical protein